MSCIEADILSPARSAWVRDGVVLGVTVAVVVAPVMINSVRLAREDALERPRVGSPTSCGIDFAMTDFTGSLGRAAPSAGEGSEAVEEVVPADLDDVMVRAPNPPKVSMFTAIPATLMNEDVLLKNDGESGGGSAVVLVEEPYDPNMLRLGDEGKAAIVADDADGETTPLGDEGGEA